MRPGQEPRRTDGAGLDALSDWIARQRPDS